MSLATQTAIAELLLNETPVTDLVGDDIALSYAPEEDDPPYIVVTRIDGQHHGHMTAGSGLVTTRLQIDYYDENELAAESLGELGRQALDGFSGDVTVGLDTLTFQMLRLDNDNTEFVRERGGSDTALARVSHDYKAAHNEVVPTFP